jgi:hypothetical protein
LLYQEKKILPAKNLAKNTYLANKNDEAQEKRLRSVKSSTNIPQLGIRGS